jgi:predicted nucleotidyltransferase
MKNNTVDWFPLKPELRGFYPFEIEKMSRIIDMFKQNKPVLEQQENFIRFVDEHDRRRGTNFVETFPQLQEFYNRIKDGM